MQQPFLKVHINVKVNRSDILPVADVLCFLLTSFGETTNSVLNLLVWNYR